jgi:hypothetical protein
MSATQPSGFARQVAAIVLLAGGAGWDAGQFVQPFFGSFFGGFIDIVHFLPALVLLVVSPSFLYASATGARANAARNWITGVAIFMFTTIAAFAVLGVVNPDPNSVGLHTFEDALPAIVMAIGSGLWVATLIAPRRASPVAIAKNMP